MAEMHRRRLFTLDANFILDLAAGLDVALDLSELLGGIRFSCVFRRLCPFLIGSAVHLCPPLVVYLRDFRG